MDLLEFNELVSEYGKNYVWKFTKHNTSFKDAYNATRLFEYWISNPATTVAKFFGKHYASVDLEKPNYRALIIAQLYGLITKNFKTYKEESITNVYNSLAESSEDKFNKIATEQVLKFKMPPFTQDIKTVYTKRHIFPAIFTYQVLKNLKVKYAINKISMDLFFSFIATANFHNEIEFVCEQIQLKKSLSSDTINQFEDESRIKGVLNNLSLFIIDANEIALNPSYESVMDTFLLTEKGSFYKNEDLKDETNYKAYLINYQNFNISLIQKDSLQVSANPLDIEEEKYKDEVEKTRISASERVTLLNNKNLEPTLEESATSRLKRNPKVGKLALELSNYKCEIDENHITFLSKSTNKQYMEAHHFIPQPNFKEYWKNFNKNIDCVENIISLCPTCHRALHYGNIETKEKNLKILFEKKIDNLKATGIDITFEELIKLYI
ncbi:MAG: HNH endonuclease [Candidatus Gastranaerophilales bacterium]|nr:HNH endonuclease [Candidatus Gastranaerophilales bacterium]